ncbi:MAG: hypothetical protein ACO3FH_11765 [Steroidobacteraceae bacterium]
MSADSRPIHAPTSGQDQQLDPVNISQLVAVSLRLAMELSAVRERLRTHELLLQKQGILSADAVDQYAPDAEETRRRLSDDRALIEALARDLGLREPT